MTAISFFLSLTLASIGGPLFFFLGLTLFFFLLLKEGSGKKRALLGFTWYALLSGYQLSWALGHLFISIVAPYLLFLLLLGSQFALLSFFLTKRASPLALAALWTLLEWGRLFIFSGHPWHPFGLELAASDELRQLASLFGIYGMTFILVWGALLFATLRFIPLTVLLFASFLFGYIRLKSHLESEKSLSVALVQTHFPIEETLGLSYHELRELTLSEWSEIIRLLKEEKRSWDLIVLPELVVPFGTYYLIYSYEEAEKAFQGSALPPLYPHFSRKIEGEERVNNAYFLFSVASVFQADVVAGLEDREEEGSFTSAFLVQPKNPYLCRYEKQLLVPMGEYIPFSSLRELAKSYGITGSFKAGESCKILEGRAKYAPSICFEEAVGSLILGYKGSDLLVNLTNDGWFPGWGLARVHLAHGRMRAVEMGIPLVRACNTGVTAAVDPFGRVIAKLGKSEKEEEEIRGVLSIELPLTKLSTLYSRFGDLPILLFATIILVGVALRLKFNK